jgi:outer membrane protein
MQTATFLSSRRRGSIAAGLAILLASTPLLAQSGQAPASAPPARPASMQAPGPVVRLSMQEAVDMSLETNLGLKAQKLNPHMAAEDLASARAAFIPSLSSSFSRNTNASVSTNFAQSSLSTISSNSTGVSAGLNQALPWYGGNYQLNWSSQRSETTAYSTFNPQLTSRLSATFNQPLMRGLSVDSARQNVKISTRALEIADVNLRQQALATERAVRSAYLSLIGALENQKVARQNLDVAQDSLRNTQARVGVGTQAPNDIYSVEADVAVNEQRLISAETNIIDAQDSLRVLVLDPARPDYWTVTIEPSDVIQITPQQIDVDAAIRNALANRTDLITERKQIEITVLNAEVLHDSTRMSANAQVSYSANGVSGTQLTYGSGFPPEILNQSSRAYTGALGDTFTNTNPSWTYGVLIGYPLGRSAQEAQYARTKLDRQQQETNLRNNELQVAESVRGAARRVETLFRQLQALQKSREAQEHNLDAAQKKFAVGFSSTFELSQIQRDVANAKLGELLGRISYNQALIDLQFVQLIR